jgi:hypothetical protein
MHNRLLMLIAATSLSACMAPRPTIPRGYTHVVGRDGEEFYCRSELISGTHSAAEWQKLCVTPSRAASIAGRQSLANAPAPAFPDHSKPPAPTPNLDAQQSALQAQQQVAAMPPQYSGKR